MRAVIYARVSSDPRSVGRSVAEQEIDCRGVAGREGWAVVRVFCDNDRSASRYAKLDRPAYVQLRDFVTSGGCDVLITWEASRFQRDLEDYVALRELCRRAGVLWSYSGRTYDLSRTDDRLSTGLDALLAERESDLTHDRVMRAVRANAVAGRPHGKLLFGYRREYDPDSGALLRQVIREDQAETIREAARRFLSGETTNAIAVDFNRRGITAARGGKWNLTLVRRLLTNPAYNGQRVHQGKTIGKADWPAILDDATYYQCVAKFADPSRPKYRDSSVKYLLTGIARCGVCDSRLKYGKPRGKASYVCVNKFCVARNLHAVDKLVEKLILLRLSQPDAASLFTRPETEISPMLTELSTTRARLDGFYDAAARGEITPNALGRIEQTMLGEIEELERKVRRADVPTVVYDLAKEPEKVWRSLTLTQRRAAVRALVDVRIHRTKRGQRILDPAAIEVDWRRWPSASPAAPAQVAEPA